MDNENLENELEEEKTEEQKEEQTENVETSKKVRKEKSVAFATGLISLILVGATLGFFLLSEIVRLIFTGNWYELIAQFMLLPLLQIPLAVIFNIVGIIVDIIKHKQNKIKLKKEI